jgi:hypothetical protein
MPKQISSIKKIFISESLTPCRADLLRRAKEHFGKTKAWSSGGNIVAVNSNDQRILIANNSDIH